MLEDAAVPSFDIVSRIDLAEVDNALAGMIREIGTRFDFKGSKCTIERQEGLLTLLADDELKLKQMHELLKVHLTRRKVDPAALEFKPPEKASGNRQRQTVMLRRGATQMPESSLGASPSGVPVPRTARPLRTRGLAFSMRTW